VVCWGANGSIADTDDDDDGLSDSEEINTYGTSPIDADTFDQPLVSATPTISKGSAASYKVANRSNRHAMDNLLYAGVTRTRQHSYLQYSPYSNIDIAGVLGFSQLRRYHQNPNHLHHQSTN
jgi:hypothetical protein